MFADRTIGHRYAELSGELKSQFLDYFNQVQSTVQYVGSFVHCIRCNGGEDIAAISSVIHKRSFDADLPEGVVDVGVVPRGGPHDGKLARQGIRTPNAINLSAVRAAKDGKNHLVAPLWIGR